MLPGIGWQELIIVLVIILVIFGPKRLPEIGRSLGKGIKEFKKSTTELQESFTKEETPPAKVEKAEAAQDVPEPMTAPEPKQAPEPKSPDPEKS